MTGKRLRVGSDMRKVDGPIASFIFEDHNHFGQSEVISEPDELSEHHKLLVLHGGEDISPSIYKEVKGPAQSNNVPSYRDLLELAVIDRAIHLGVPILAICRGAQLACAKFGGKLYQDAPCHESGDHPLIIDNDNENFETLTNSCHHQMMIPDSSAKILAHAGLYEGRRWKTDRWVKEDIKEPEVVWWKDQQVLGVQGHPEWHHTPGGLAIYKYTMKLLYRYFGV